MSSTIFILGGFGYLGINIAKKLIDTHYNVVIIDINPKPIPVKLSCISYCCDVRNVNYIFTLVNKFKPSCFIWCINLLPCNTLYYDININGLTNVINILNISGIQQFIYMSSTDVYGYNEYANENTICAPYTTDGKTKLLSEDIIIKQYQFDYFILRVSNVYGEFVENVPNIKDNILNQIRLFNNNVIQKIYINNKIQDYIHIEDFLDIVLKCMYKLNVYVNNKCILNIGIENVKCEHKIFNQYYQQTDKAVLYEVQNIKTIINSLNCTKTKSTLLWSPRYKTIIF